MIVQLLLDLVYGLFYLLTAQIKIDMLPAEAVTYIAEIGAYFAAGLSFLSNYIDLEYLTLLFGLVVAVDVGVTLYHFVMWVLRKIPILGIK